MIRTHIKNTLNKIVEMKQLPNEGPGSVYINNAPHYGGYEIREVLAEGGVSTWNDTRLKPKEMLEFLLKIRQEVQEPPEYKSRILAEQLQNQLLQNQEVKQQKKLKI